MVTPCFRTFAPCTMLGQGGGGEGARICPHVYIVSLLHVHCIYAYAQTCMCVPKYYLGCNKGVGITQGMFDQKM